MNMVVLLKQTFDTEEKIELVNGSVAEDHVKFIINPYDEYALEEALRLREKHGGSVTVVACGPDRAGEALRTALAMGADEAVLVADNDLPDDGLAIAAALAEIVKSIAPDLVLAGLFAIDRGAGSIALQVAERLRLPHASAALKLDIRECDELPKANTSGGSSPYTTILEANASVNSSPANGAVKEGVTEKMGGCSDHHLEEYPGVKEAGKRSMKAAVPEWEAASELIASVERETEWGIETVLLPLPALITAQQGLNEPRYPSLPGIMKAKRKSLRHLTVNELHLTADDLTPRSERLALLTPPPRAAGKKLTGTPEEQTVALVELLCSEANLFGAD